MGGVPEKTCKFFFSDSLSSQQAIHAFQTKDPQVLGIKNKLMLLGVLAYLAHVCSDRGVNCNERANVLAKECTFLDVTNLNYL